MPSWLKGGIFFAVLLLLVFFLKILCPLDVGCFVDPFFVPIFSPLILVDFITGSSANEVFGSFEPVFVFVFWIFVGVVLGQVFGKIKLPDLDKEEDSN